MIPFRETCGSRRLDPAQSKWNTSHNSPQAGAWSGCVSINGAM
jgi:hypothetical protein